MERKLGIALGVTAGVILIAGVSYYAYQKHKASVINPTDDAAAEVAAKAAGAGLGNTNHVTGTGTGAGTGAGSGTGTGNQYRS